jgi:hypothetical protein
MKMFAVRDLNDWLDTPSVRLTDSYTTAKQYLETDKNG